MSQTLLSIIIPSYNMGTYLRECLSTLYTSDATNVQIIVVNDGSTDNTANVLSLFDDRHGFIHISTSNHGVSAARNTGISLAEGQYIWFIDADDRVDPTFIKRVTSILEHGTYNGIPWDLIAFGSQNVSASGRTTLHTCDKDIRLESTNQFREQFDDIFSIIPYNVPWNKIFRRDIVIQHQLQFPPMLTGEDAAFMTSYLPYVNSCYVSAEAPYFYQLESTASMRSTHQAMKEYQDNWERIIYQMNVFKKLGLTCGKVTSESIFRLVYGTYILLYRDTRLKRTGIRGFLSDIRMMPNLKEFLALGDRVPIAPRIRIIRFLSHHPLAFYIYYRLRSVR